MTYLDGSHVRIFTHMTMNDGIATMDATKTAIHEIAKRIASVYRYFLWFFAFPFLFPTFLRLFVFTSSILWDTLIFVFAIHFIVSKVFDFEHRFFSVIIKFIYPVANSFDTSHVWLLGFREQKLIVSIGLRASIMNSEINSPIWAA